MYSKKAYCQDKELQSTPGNITAKDAIHALLPVHQKEKTVNQEIKSNANAPIPDH